MRQKYSQAHQNIVALDARDGRGQSFEQAKVFTNSEIILWAF